MVVVVGKLLRCLVHSTSFEPLLHLCSGSVQRFRQLGRLGGDSAMAAHAVSKLWSCGSFNAGIEHVADASGDLSAEELQRELQEPAAHMVLYRVFVGIAC